jgi:hypothetical protein
MQNDAFITILSAIIFAIITIASAILVKKRGFGKFKK